MTALRELAPSVHESKLFRSTFEGEIGPQHISVGYRFGWFAPPVRLATFSGQLREVGDNTEIAGNISSGWIVYLFAAWFLVAPPLAIYQDISAGDYSGVGWTVAIVVLLLFLGRAFVRSTQEHVVDEIARAIRGKVSDD